MKHIIIDTDPGDDDASAVLWLLASGEVEVDALTVTHGNVELEKCVNNALRILEIAGRTDIPVFIGAAKPLIRPARHAHWIHGGDGLGDAGVPEPVTCPAEGYASAEMARLAMRSPEPITIVALGPLTNVALAIALEPRLKEKVREIVVMGGAVRVPGNESPCASFNIAGDAEAANIVYNSGIPVVQVGLDVCDLVTQTIADLDTICAAHTSVTDWLIKVLDYRRNRAVQKIFDENGNLFKTIRASEQVAGRGQGIGLNDLTAAGYVVNPAWFKTVNVRIDVEIHGSVTYAQTVADFNGLSGKTPNAFLPIDVDGQALVARWVADMVRYSPGEFLSVKN